MENVTDPGLIADIRRYGHFDVDGCYNCGSCAAVCALSEDSALFPRKSMRLAQLGLRERLLGSLDPWLCYYCGDCSKTCPRQTEPGESMMTLRRFLTAQYDWTGLSARMYRSAWWELGVLGAVGLLTGWIMSRLMAGMPTELTAQGGVRINEFLPMTRVHAFDWVMAAGLTFFLMSNVARFFWYTMLRDGDAPPLRSYVSELWTLVWDGATQIRFRECGENSPRWVKHLLLVTGYGLMFSLIVFFLPWFQTENLYPLWHPQRWLGYYATAVLTVFAVEILWSRVKKEEEIHRFSDLSDWLFPILLLLTTLTGIAVHVFRYAGWPFPMYYAYFAHMMVAVPMLTVEVPFGKWAHISYRPLAAYFQAVKTNAAGLRRAEGAAPDAAADAGPKAQAA
ncbi:MAG: 4Fe-4S dicluster domain-containing protein [Elusimicrobia bacterium]|nr:4Fe-4S dicluster domain-containing protein [Elusimicrobiota bacterium]